MDPSPAPIGYLVACDPLPAWMVWLERWTPRLTPKPPRHRTHALSEGATKARCGLSVSRLDTVGYETSAFDDVSPTLRCKVCDMVVHSA